MSDACSASSELFADPVVVPPPLISEEFDFLRRPPAPMPVVEEVVDSNSDLLCRASFDVEVGKATIDDVLDLSRRRDGPEPLLPGFPVKDSV